MPRESALRRPEDEECQGGGHERRSQHADHADRVWREEVVDRIEVGNKDERRKEVYIENVEQAGQADRSAPSDQIAKDQQAAKFGCL